MLRSLSQGVDVKTLMTTLDFSAQNVLEFDPRGFWLKSSQMRNNLSDQSNCRAGLLTLCEELHSAEAGSQESGGQMSRLLRKVPEYDIAQILLEAS